MGNESTQILQAPGGRSEHQDFSAAEQCPHCRSSIAAGDEFCPLCGYQRGSWPSGSAASAATHGAGAGIVPGRYQLVGTDGRQYNLQDGETIAGRGEVALRIDDGFISRQHAKFTVDGNTVTLSDLGSSNGTFVGERRLEPGAPVALASGDSFRLGELELILRENPAYSDATVAIAPSPPEAELAAAATLEPDREEAPGGSSPVLSGWRITAVDGPDFALPIGDSICGRKPGLSQLVVPDGYISGQHCSFSATPEALAVTDMGSTNGTFVNDEQLTAETARELAAGDSLRLGQLEFSVQHEALAVGADAPEQAPVA